MEAQPGDMLIVRGHRIGQPNRVGEVLEARGHDGKTEPFLVRWDDDGHSSLFFPGADCVVEHLAHTQGKNAKKKNATKEAAR